MSLLEDTQALFWQAITWPTGVAAFLRQASPAARQRFAQTFNESGTVSAIERMEVYANAYFWRLHGVLEENHPVIAWVLGEAAFRNLATDYVLAHPSSHPDLRRFSEHMPAFLRARTAIHPGLAAIAQVELHVGDFLHAPDLEPLHVDALRALEPSAWPRLRLRAAPTLAFVDVELDYLVLDRARRADEAAPVELPTLATAHCVLVWRKGHAVLRRTCPADQGAALRAMCEGQDFTHMSLAAAQARMGSGGGADHDPQAFALKLSQDLAAWLHRWVLDEMVLEIIAPSAPD